MAHRNTLRIQSLTAARAIRLGRRDGIADVDNVLAEQGAEVVAGTLVAGHLGWDEGAINAGAHRSAGVSDADRSYYYGAYAASARRAAQQVKESL